MEHIIPECRYGHGPLEKQLIERMPEIVAFVLVGLKKQEPGYISVLNAGFIADVYKCQQCSYVELHDQPLDDL